MDRVRESYAFLSEYANNKIIYGINTGFGPMAQWRIEDKDLKQLQYNIIRSHSTGTGEPLSRIQVRATMMARIGSFLQGRSGIHPDVVELLTAFLNKDITPFVPRHGSVGASGDLVQLAHIALTLIGEGMVLYKGQWRPTCEVMTQEHLKPIDIHIREGLSVTNGTSVMTGIGIVNLLEAEVLLDWATLSAVWMNEIASSYDDFIAKPLNEVRRQRGQSIIAERMRNLSADSRRMRKREHYLYDGPHNESMFQHKVQAYYSLRCAPQILGPIYDTIEAAREVLENELNSACDNPIVDPDTKNVYHGGNFHGDYISIEADILKIAMVRLCMTAERQINYLFHDRINGILPPFLNAGVLGLNYGMQACQFTATSTTAESQTLAMPNYVHSIPNNNDNQDIVSMGTNSQLLCSQVIDNVFQVLAIQYIALAQATDILAIKDEICSASSIAYSKIREIVPFKVEDTPFYEEINRVNHFLRSSPLTRILTGNV